MFSTEDLILILFVALLLFGANKLPELARSLGKATGEFKKAQLESENELKQLNKPVSDKDTRIRDLAVEMGINVENKTSEQLIEEIHSKVKPDTDPSVKRQAA
ncbi:Sec-independent protein translocase protein TatAt [uncultured archaeon]|nr:Sec-independent protein translocase protein TatAt [uncultured archaeon]